MTGPSFPDHPPKKQPSVVEEHLNTVDTALSKFNNGEINEVQFLGEAIQIWKAIKQDKELTKKLKAYFHQQRQILHELAPLDISKGDPVRERYDPNLWVGQMTPEMKGKTEEFFQDKMSSFRLMLENLYK